MQVKTNGYYRSKGIAFTDETSAGITTGVNYIYLRLYSDGSYKMGFRRDVKDLDFVKYTDNAEIENHPIEQGTYEVVADNRIKFTIIPVYRDEPIIFHYIIKTPEFLISDKGEEFEFIKAGVN